MIAFYLSFPFALSTSLSISLSRIVSFSFHFHQLGFLWALKMKHIDFFFFKNFLAAILTFLGAITIIVIIRKPFQCIQSFVDNISFVLVLVPMPSNIIRKPHSLSAHLQQNFSSYTYICPKIFVNSFLVCSSTLIPTYYLYFNVYLQLIHSFPFAVHNIPSHSQLFAYLTLSPIFPQIKFSVVHLQ